MARRSGGFVKLAGGAVAVLVATAAARADDEAAARTVEITVVDGGAGSVEATPGEPVRLVFQRTTGPSRESIVLPDQGVVEPLPLGHSVTITVRSAGSDIGYRVQRDATAGAQHDPGAAELDAGNTGGRG